MIRDYKTVKLTEEDKKNFTYKMYDDNENKERLIKLKYNLYKSIFKFLFLSIPAITLIYLKISETVKYISILYLIVLVFVFIINIYCKCYNIINRKKCYIEIVILKKLDREFDYEYGGDGINGIFNFYPVLGKDTCNDYVSKCYINEESYIKSKVGDKVKIDV